MNAFRLIVLLAGGAFAAAMLSPSDGIRVTATARAAATKAAATAASPRLNVEDSRKRHREDMHLAGDKKNAASNVFWTFGVAIKDGKLAALKGLIREMSDASKANEPGTLIYEWTISDDAKTAEVHERYADSDAALRHLASFNANFADRLMALVEPTGMTVYGDPSAALRKDLEGAKPVYRKVLGGFVR